MGQNTPGVRRSCNADRTVLYLKSEDLYARATNTPAAARFQGRGHSWSAINPYEDSINGRPTLT